MPTPIRWHGTPASARNRLKFAGPRADNGFMFELTTDPAKFNDPLLDDPAVIAADRQAVQRFVETREPIDMEIRLRIRARADRARERAFERHGDIDIDQFRRPTTWDE